MQSPRPQTPRYELVARISKTIGLDGQLVALEQGELSVLRAGLEVWIVPPSLEGVRHSVIGEVKPSKHKSGLLVQLEGVTDRTQASELVDRYLLARVEDSIASDQLANCPEKDKCSPCSHVATKQGIDGELHSEQSNWHSERSEESLTHVTCFEDVKAGDLGTLSQTKTGPAYDIWVIEGPYGVLEIPAVEAYLAPLDGENAAGGNDKGYSEETVLLNLPPGFIEVTAQSNKEDNTHAH